MNRRLLLYTQTFDEFLFQCMHHWLSMTHVTIRLPIIQARVTLLTSGQCTCKAFWCVAALDILVECYVMWRVEEARQATFVHSTGTPQRSIWSTHFIRRSVGRIYMYIYTPASWMTRLAHSTRPIISKNQPIGRLAPLINKQVKVGELWLSHCISV